jgi:hypothetical protein
MLIVNRDGSMDQEVSSGGPTWHLRRLVQLLKRAMQPYTIRFVTYHQPACTC